MRGRGGRWGEVAVADHVPGGVPDDGAGERVRDAGEAVFDGGPGRGVEPDLRVGEVLVVGDDEDGAPAGQGEGFAGAGDVGLDPVAQDEPVGAGAEFVVVEADRDAVGAAAAVVDGEGPLVAEVLDAGGEGVGAGGAQPGVGPAVDVAVGGGGEVVDEVGEAGVRELVAGEVGVDAGQEVLLADPGDELAERGGALGVGDAVEVDERGGGVGDGCGVGGDRVGGGRWSASYPQPLRATPKSTQVSVKRVASAMVW